MEKNLYLDFKPQDEMSDTLSTSAASLNHLPYEENSPSAALSVNSTDNELSQGSKKIRKKRNAYGKIDDDTRLKLLEAVQRGETLKSAAKRYGVNYSSAKSIFHIFRKEGRILKKATTEKGFGFDFPNQGGEPEPQQQFPNNNMNNMNMNMNRFGQGFQNVGFQPVIQNLEQRQAGHGGMFQNLQENSGAASPLNGLVNNFADLLRIGNQMNPNQVPTPEDILRNKNPHMALHPSRFNPNNSTSPTHSMLKMQPNQQMPQSFGQMSQMNLQMNQMNQVNLQMGQMNQMNLQRNQLNNQLNQMSQQMAQITLASKPTSNMVSPSERMKQFDNFYMNYSNSPLSGNSRMIREGSESGSNRNLQKEFDSFSDMVTAFQSQNHLTESLKKNEAAMKFQQHTPTVQQQQQQMGGEKNEDDKSPWGGTLEGAALDTFKSFIDAQMVLNNAFKKASLLNNLVQIQKSKTDGSPSTRFLNLQGNQ